MKFLLKSDIVCHHCEKDLILLCLNPVLKEFIIDLS